MVLHEERVRRNLTRPDELARYRADRAQCVYFAQGRCHYGIRCRNPHDHAARLPKCKNFPWCTDASCVYSHASPRRRLYIDILKLVEADSDAIPQYIQGSHDFVVHLLIKDSTLYLCDTLSYSNEWRSDPFKECPLQAERWRLHCACPYKEPSSSTSSTFMFGVEDLQQLAVAYCDAAGRVALSLTCRGLHHLPHAMVAQEEAALEKALPAWRGRVPLYFRTRARCRTLLFGSPEGAAEAKATSNVHAAKISVLHEDRVLYSSTDTLSEQFARWPETVTVVEGGSGEEGCEGSCRFFCTTPEGTFSFLSRLPSGPTLSAEMTGLKALATSAVARSEGLFALHQVN